MTKDFNLQFESLPDQGQGVSTRDAIGNERCKGSEKCETYFASCLSVAGIGTSPSCQVPQFREKFGAVAKRPCQQQTRTCQHFQALQQEDLVYDQCQTFLLSLVTIWLV